MEFKTDLSKSDMKRVVTSMEQLALTQRRLLRIRDNCYSQGRTWMYAKNMMLAVNDIALAQSRLIEVMETGDITKGGETCKKDS